MLERINNYKTVFNSLQNNANHIYIFFLNYHYNILCCLCFLDEEKFKEMNKKIQLLKTQKENDKKDKEELKRQVFEKNKECKTLNNRLQEAKVNI